MQREYIDSSLFISIGYDAISAILECEFKSGGAIWQYFGVPENIYLEMMAANSRGRYFLQNIKGQYSENRIG